VPEIGAAPGDAPTLGAAGGVMFVGVGGVAAGGAEIVGMMTGGPWVIIVGAGGATGAAGRIFGVLSAVLVGDSAALLFVLNVTLAERGFKGDALRPCRSPAAGAILYSHIPQAKTESVISDLASLEEA